MKIIAHRANVAYPNFATENHPYQILEAIRKGFDVEIDVWKIDEKIFLGHDRPEYLVDDDLLIYVGNYAWFHCKNFEALDFFNNTMPHMNYFWHQDDDYTMTSMGYIWVNPGMPAGEKSVIVLPENSFAREDMVRIVKEINPYAVCTDYPEDFI